MGHEAEDRLTVSLAGLAATLLILVLSLVVVRKLQVRCLMETCMMSGHPGCVEEINRIRVSRMFASD